MPSSQLFSKSIRAVLICFALLSCKTKSERKAIELISKSIESHGGSEGWANFESLTFLKETTLYRADSSIENQVQQKIEVRFIPRWEVKMSWQKDSILHRSVFDGNKTSYWLGENEIQNVDFLKSKKRDLDAAAYVMTKPFDLLAGEKKLEYLGLKQLPDGKEYESVQVIDRVPGQQPVDVWIYYFDPNDSRLMAYSVKTADHTSLVFNHGLDYFYGLLLPQRRESYRLLENGKIDYLRAEYKFYEYHINR